MKMYKGVTCYLHHPWVIGRSANHYHDGVRSYVHNTGIFHRTAGSGYYRRTMCSLVVFGRRKEAFHLTVSYLAEVLWSEMNSKRSNIMSL
jgi:hypothetical protein